jgi:hypothetical protein
MSVLENSNLPFDVKQYFDVLSELESQGKGDYAARNRLGYLGRYQMGAKALADIGWVKPGTTNKGLMDKKNWLIADYKNFMSNPDVQDTAAKMMLEKSHARAMKSGILSPDMPPHEQASHMAGIHLVGQKGYKKSLAGEDVRDANKMSPSHYYDYVYQRFAPKQEEAPAQLVPQQEQPWWANPLEAGKAYIKGLF